MKKMFIIAAIALMGANCTAQTGSPFLPFNDNGGWSSKEIADSISVNPLFLEEFQDIFQLWADQDGWAKELPKGKVTKEHTIKLLYAMKDSTLEWEDSTFAIGAHVGKRNIVYIYRESLKDRVNKIPGIEPVSFSRPTEALGLKGNYPERFIACRVCGNPVRYPSDWEDQKPAPAAPTVVKNTTSSVNYEAMNTAIKMKEEREKLFGSRGGDTYITNNYNNCCGTEKLDTIVVRRKVDCCGNTTSESYTTKTTSYTPIFYGNPGYYGGFHYGGFHYGAPGYGYGYGYGGYYGYNNYGWNSGFGWGISIRFGAYTPNPYFAYGGYGNFWNPVPSRNIFTGQQCATNFNYRGGQYYGPRKIR